MTDLAVTRAEQRLGLTLPRSYVDAVRDRIGWRQWRFLALDDVYRIDDRLGIVIAVEVDARDGASPTLCLLAERGQSGTLSEAVYRRSPGGVVTELVGDLYELFARKSAPSLVVGGVRRA